MKTIENFITFICSKYFVIKIIVMLTTLDSLFTLELNFSLLISDLCRQQVN